jgi:hypothetical protein
LKYRFIALNAFLLIGIAAIVWQARTRVQEAHARREVNLNPAIKPVTPPPVTPAPKPAAVPAASYADVANKDLFVKDRNPVVIVDPPKVEQPKPMPPLPVVYGVLGLPSGTKAIMAEKKNEPGAPVQEGDKVGEFTIVSLDPQNVTFEWDGKEIKRKIDELIDRSGPADTSGGGRATVQPAAAPVVSQQIQSQQPAPQQNNVQTNNVPASAASLGIEIGAPGQSERACTPGDNSPAGTVVNGYKKTTMASPFGVVCRWVPAQ